MTPVCARGCILKRVVFMLEAVCGNTTGWIVTNVSGMLFRHTYKEKYVELLALQGRYEEDCQLVQTASAYISRCTGVLQPFVVTACATLLA
jgi:hypothetical protein